MGAKKLYKIVEKFLKKNDWEYEFDKESNVFHCGIGFDGCIGNADVYINFAEEYVACAIILPLHAPKDMRPAVCELICRFGYMFAFGQFVMNCDDGEIRYRYVMPLEELVDDPMVKAQRLLYLPSQMVERYGPAFLKVMLGLKTPVAAINEIEDGDDGESTSNDDNGRQRKSNVDGGHSAQKCILADNSRPKDLAKRKKASKKDEASIPVPVCEYSLDGLCIRGDLALSKIVTATRNFRKLQSDTGGASAALPDRPRMSLLLWGPPGTGKTEFVNYLGQQLGCKVVVKTASDILDHWVGKTEKAIRAAFEEAEEENAILFLDELDGLMQDRSGAIANWEVTQVNELLGCMERFKGIMIGATNFKDHLDSAVMRRFTYKLQFDYLEPDGKLRFFDRAFKTPLSDSERTRLEQIPGLTPGDFKTVSQKLFYLGEDIGNAERLAALEEEASLKKDGRRRTIGFSAG